jgi:peptidoglycan/xylan/chitin deacetylase (PgdA/CDA1 family)
MPFRKVSKILAYVLGFVGTFAICFFLLSCLGSPWGAIGMGIGSVFFAGGACLLVDMMVPGINLFSHAPTRLPKSFASDHVAVTFDDGPSPRFTDQILKILKDENVKATFFCVGAHVERYPDLLRKMVEGGHTVATHSFDHKVLPFLSLADLDADFSKTCVAFEKACGFVPRFFRCPKGYKSPWVARAAKRRGMKMVGFSYPIYDIDNPPPEVLIANVARRLKAGDILLMHERHRHMDQGMESSVVAALPTILKMIRDRGLKPISMDQVF